MRPFRDLTQGRGVARGQKKSKQAKNGGKGKNQFPAHMLFHTGYTISTPVLPRAVESADTSAYFPGQSGSNLHLGDTVTGLTAFQWGIYSGSLLSASTEVSARLIPNPVVNLKPDWGMYYLEADNQSCFLGNHHRSKYAGPLLFFACRLSVSILSFLT